MLMIVAAAAIMVAETLSIGVASAQQTPQASPTPNCSNGSSVQIGDNAEPSVKQCKVAISVSPISRDFGSVKVGTDSSPQYVTLTNTGDVPVNILVSYSEDNPPYKVTGLDCQNLQPQQSCQIEAVFHPRKTDPTTVIVTLVGHPVSGSLPDSESQIVSLTGVGA